MMSNEVKDGGNCLKKVSIFELEKLIIFQGIKKPHGGDNPAMGYSKEGFRRADALMYLTKQKSLNLKVCKRQFEEVLQRPHRSLIS
jgi:hypothetical protein